MEDEVKTIGIIFIFFTILGAYETNFQSSDIFVDDDAMEIFPKNKEKEKAKPLSCEVNIKKKHALDSIDIDSNKFNTKKNCTCGCKNKTRS